MSGRISRGRKLGVARKVFHRVIYYTTVGHFCPYGGHRILWCFKRTFILLETHVVCFVRKH